ncbi:flagellar biosynthesis protein FlgG [Bacillus thuringiensis]|nr:flagellar biosynthesis protein FlgG [Bacillus thuringiensis serovar tolworthi]OTZ85162.1 flagellar biosynthesis protein FlgG [Bacillus thuringiensis serovar colmeri]PEK94614.1 flagellar biosynthesis protein FlgG [Bacillus thuringiensis]PER99362.1 flagellar biosynthesis protein FlgG [Bacillus cereus]PEV31945.1 flagellar biosynthesis protein FlgG [Bacillus cereus]
MKMNNDIYRTFVSCFNEIGELQVSDEEFAEKSEMLNRWMMTLDEERRAQVAAEVSPFIIKAAQHIRDKQKILEEMIMENDGRMKANSFYGKY